jgi:hypothetical protein
MADLINRPAEDDQIEDRDARSRDLKERGAFASGSGMFLFINLLLLIAAIVVSWLLVKTPSTANGLLTMFLWLAVVSIAAASIIFSRIGPPARALLLAGTSSSIILLLGLISAFFSGDKFDTVRAALIFILMSIFAYRGKRKALAAL